MFSQRQKLRLNPPDPEHQSFSLLFWTRSTMDSLSSSQGVPIQFLFQSGTMVLVNSFKQGGWRSFLYSNRNQLNFPGKQFISFFGRNNLIYCKHLSFATSFGSSEIPIPSVRKEQTSLVLLPSFNALEKTLVRKLVLKLHTVGKEHIMDVRAKSEC